MTVNRSESLDPSFRSPLLCEFCSSLSDVIALCTRPFVSYSVSVNDIKVAICSSRPGDSARGLGCHGSRAIEGLAVIQTNSAGSRITSNEQPLLRRTPMNRHGSRVSRLTRHYRHTADYKQRGLSHNCYSTPLDA